MPTTLTLPKLSPTMEEGTIVQWHKKEGDLVEAGDLLLEIATDKATVEHLALDSGILRKILVKENESAIVNQPIAIFTEDKNESIEGYKPVGDYKAVPEKKNETATPLKPEAASVKETTYSQPLFQPEPPLENYQFKFGAEKELKASPLAKKLAKDAGLDISTVKGSGPGGRIVKADLEMAVPHARFAFRNSETPTEIPGSYSEELLSPMRKVIAKRLQEAKSFIPHFYVEQTVSVDLLVELREQLSHLGVKLSFNDCMIKAVAIALKEHQAVNSGFNSANNSVIRFKTIDISVAVNVKEGLITPIIRHADFKNLSQISTEMRSLAARAKEGKLDSQEYKGGSFTLSNMGMYGITRFQAIINPPQAAILAVGGILDVPVVRKGSIVPGKVMNLCLSADHRVIDGAIAASFIKTLQEILENPASLLL